MEDHAPGPRPIRRLCWSCSGLFECEQPSGPLATVCSARCPYCAAVTTALVPPPCGPPFPGAFERPPSAKVALRRVRRLLKRRRHASALVGCRYLVEWEEDPTADYALLADGKSKGKSAHLQPISWEPELNVTIDPELVAAFDETRRPNKESVVIAPPRQSGWGSAAPTHRGGPIQLTVAAHLLAAPGELPVAPRQPAAIWLPDDQVEVQWKGKGFRGSWALATVSEVEGEHRIKVRFADFIDESGHSLEEWLPRSRLRLVPPAVHASWRPVPGDHVEARSNDLWWEGAVERYDSLKGYLFVYDCHRSWLWLPLSGLRPRPTSAVLSYHRGRTQQDASEEGEETEEGEGEDEDEEGAPAAARQRRPRDKCPHAGCKLLERHSGLCQFGDDSLAGRAKERSTRPKGDLMERSNRIDLLEQEEILETIRRQRNARHASMRAREARMPSKVIPGSRMAQWHPQLFAEQFCTELAPILVFEGALAPAACRGQLVILASHIVADVLRMLGSELAIDINGKQVLCVPHAPAGAAPAPPLAVGAHAAAASTAGPIDLATRPRGEPVVRWMPAETRIDLLVVDAAS